MSDRDTLAMVKSGMEAALAVGELRGENKVLREQIAELKTSKSELREQIAQDIKDLRRYGKPDLTEPFMEFTDGYWIALPEVLQAIRGK